MGTDKNGIYTAGSREIAASVYLSEAGAVSAASKTALKDLPEALRHEGMEVLLTADRSRWQFSAASTAADASENLVLTPSVGSGRWLRVDAAVALKLAFAFGTADAAVLFTTPTGFRLALQRLWWEITTGLTGGSSSAVGVSSGQTGLSTKGDLLGGAGGDVAATLVQGAAIGGTIGAKFGSNGQPVLEAAGTLRFDRITSAFTAGAGYVHCLARVIA